MADLYTPGATLPRRAKIIGTAFLLFQLLFALNNYGPQRIPVLNRFVSKPFFAPNVQASQVGQGTVRFEDVTEAAGLGGFRRAAFFDESPLYLEVMGGGVAVGDVDADGWEDVFFTSLPAFYPGIAAGSPSSLYRNRGDGTFEDWTAAAGLTGITGYPQGALFFDYDNDGDPDLYVAAYDGGQLFRNDPGPGPGQARHFTDITAAAGLDLRGRCGALPCFGSAASAADYDRDGDLDLLLVNNVYWDLDDPAHHGRRNLFPAFFHPQPAFLFRNEGNGAFADVTGASGLDNRGGKGLSAAWVDVNADQWPDVYIANDLSPNTLYLNRGDGTFMEFGKAAGLDEIKSSMGVGAADFDNDGAMDLVTTNLKGSKLSLFRNLGDLRFDYATDYAGLASSARATGWGVAFVDVDLDGYTDLVSGGGPVWEAEPKDTESLLFRNLGGHRFEDISRTSGDLGSGNTSRGLAVLDFDRDGCPDLILANVDGASPRLLKNHLKEDRHWLSVRLEGTQSNRDGIGARVEVERADGLRLTQEVRAGGSYQSTNTRTLFFGLAQSSVKEMRVFWPSGKVDLLKDLPVNEALVVREGAGTAEVEGGRAGTGPARLRL